MPGVVVEVSDFESLRVLDRVRGGLAPSGLADLFEELAAVLESQVQYRFDKKVDPDGIRWKKWAPSTKAEREKAGYNQSRNLLQLSSPGLRDTFKADHGPDWVQLKTTSPYAGYHEQVEPPKSDPPALPRRAMLFGKNGGIGRDDYKEIEATIKDYFEELLL